MRSLVAIASHDRKERRAKRGGMGEESCSISQEHYHRCCFTCFTASFTANVGRNKQPLPDTIGFNFVGGISRPFCLHNTHMFGTVSLVSRKSAHKSSCWFLSSPTPCAKAHLAASAANSRREKYRAGSGKIREWAESSRVVMFKLEGRMHGNTEQTTRRPHARTPKPIRCTVGPIVLGVLLDR